MSIAVTWRVYDTEVTHHVAFAQSDDFSAGSTLEQQLSHAESKAFPRRHLPNDHIGVGVMTCHGNAERSAEFRRRTPVVGMCVGQSQDRYAPPAKLPDDARGRPTCAAIEEDVVDEVGIDGVGRKAVELPDTVGDGSQSERSLREPVLIPSTQPLPCNPRSALWSGEHKLHPLLRLSLSSAR